ncbi:hypothetical protein KCU77_g1704, partial [Aureobasidium melanogenum]
MASETIDMPPENVEMSSEDVETSSEDVEDSDSDRDLEGTPYGPRHLYRPFKQHVEVREIDLRALNNTDWDKFNEWLEEIRKTGGRDDSVLEEMNCDSVKFVGSLPKGYEFVSKPRPLKGKRRASKKDGGKNNGTEKKETPQRTHDKLLYGHPHPMASPFTSVTVFVKHAYWLIGRYADAYGDNDDCECKPCDTSYAAAAICDGWVQEE